MKKIISVFLLLYSISGRSQYYEMPTQKPHIEVTGTASREVIPDKIFISITLSDKVVDFKTYSIQSQEDLLKKSLSKINIDLNNLFLSDANSEITRYKNKETGYRVTKEFTLQVKSAEEVSKVFKALYAINIKESSIARTESSIIDSLRKEVRIEAIKAAKNKAEYLLKAIGGEIDKPLEIREQGDIPYYRDNIANSSNTILVGDSDSKESESNFKKFSIKFSYFIRYSIK